MVFDFFRDKRDSTNGTKGRFDPADLRKTVRTESLLTFFQKCFATGALRGKKKLEKS
jgi:hypothetical protein